MNKTLSNLDIGPRSALILIGSDNPTGNPSHSRASANSDADSSSQSEATTAGSSYVGKFFSFFSPYVYGRPAAPQEQTSSSSASLNSTFQKAHGNIHLGLPCCMLQQCKLACNYTQSACNVFIKSSYNFVFDETSDANPVTTRALREGVQPPMANSSRPEPPLVTRQNAGSNQESTAQAARLSHRRGGGANVHTLRGDDDAPPSQGNTYWNGNSTQFGGNDEAKED